MKPTKLPSGKWRVRVYLGEVGGKKKWKSVTADTKKDAMMQAAIVEKNPAVGKVQDVVKRYIEIKENVLSPYTITNYKGILRRYIDGTKLGKTDLSQVNSVKVQEWISCLAMEHSPKTIKNAYGLLSASVYMFSPQTALHVTLPQNAPNKHYTPSRSDVKRLIAAIQDDKELLLCVCLSACCSLRRGEVCALTAADFDYENHSVCISKSLYRDDFGNYLVKPPKTNSSVRTIPVPEEIMALVPKEDPIVSINPNVVTMRFRRALKRAGLPHFRYHDLRHYFATIMSYMKVPDRIIQEIGGWKTDYVMKKVYTGVIDEEMRKQANRMAEIFSDELGKVDTKVDTNC